MGPVQPNRGRTRRAASGGTNACGRAKRGRRRGEGIRLRMPGHLSVLARQLTSSGTLGRRSLEPQETGPTRLAIAATQSLRALVLLDLPRSRFGSDRRARLPCCERVCTRRATPRRGPTARDSTHVRRYFTHGWSVVCASEELRSVGHWLISWWPYVAVPAGMLFALLAVVPLHPAQLGRRRRKALVVQGLGARRPDHRARRRGRLSGRAAPRRPALRLLALAVQRATGCGW